MCTGLYFFTLLLNHWTLATEIEVGSDTPYPTSITVRLIGKTNCKVSGENLADVVPLSIVLENLADHPSS